MNRRAIPGASTRSGRHCPYPFRKRPCPHARLQRFELCARRRASVRFQRGHALARPPPRKRHGRGGRAWRRRWSNRTRPSASRSIFPMPARTGTTPTTAPGNRSPGASMSPDSRGSGPSRRRPGHRGRSRRQAPGPCPPGKQSEAATVRLWSMTECRSPDRLPCKTCCSSRHRRDRAGLVRPSDPPGSPRSRDHLSPVIGPGADRYPDPALAAGQRIRVGPQWRDPPESGHTRRAARGWQILSLQ